MNQLPDNNIEFSHVYQDKIEKKDNRIAFFGGILHPWRRFFARFIDTILFVYPLYYIGFDLSDSIHILTNTLYIPIISIVIMNTLWIPLEAMCITYFGATPGKWLFGIRVKDRSGSRLIFSSAIKRTLYMYVVGAGLGLPIVTIFTLFFSFTRLLQTGTTVWDAANNSVVTHTPWGYIRTFCCVITVFAAFVFYFYSTTLYMEDFD